MLVMPGVGAVIISTRAPTGGATVFPFALYSSLYDFYSRPHGRGDDIYQGCPNESYSDFYSRPHGRGDMVSFIIWSMMRISTRAPTGGATCALMGQWLLFNISTRAPTGGATWD